MKIKECLYEDLYKTGVYKFTNLQNQKCYIGATTSQYFYKRWSQHLAELKNNSHKNKFLQDDYNFYNDENLFEFEIMKVMDKSEKMEINLLEEKIINEYFGKNCYNVSPYSNKPYCENIYSEKRKQSFLVFNNIAKDYYMKIKDGEITLQNIPKKYQKTVNKWINHISWNKGLTSENTDFSYLKGVPKTITSDWIDGRIKASQTMRNKSNSINVYDYNANYICTFRSISDLVDYSKNFNHLLPLLLRNPEKRNSRKQQNGIDIFKLGVTNIERVCKRKSKHHKGLMFRYESDVQDVEKLTPKDIQFKRHHFKYFYFNGNLLLSEEILIEKRNNIVGILQNNLDNTEIIYISDNVKL